MCPALPRPGRVPPEDPPVRNSPAVWSETSSPGIGLPNLVPGGPGYLPIVVWRQRTPPTPKEVAKAIAAFTPPVWSETLSPGICLPNLVPGGHDGLPRTPRKEQTPKKLKLTEEEWAKAVAWDDTE